MTSRKAWSDNPESVRAHKLGCQFAAKKRKKRDNPEQRLQFAVAKFLHVALRKPTWWSAIGHGGGGGLRGIFLKAMGVKPGIADLLIVHPDEVQSFPWVIWIELKADKGDQSDPQKDFQRTMEILSPNCVYYIARSVDEVECFLRGLRVPLHARLA